MNQPMEEHEPNFTNVSTVHCSSSDEQSPAKSGKDDAEDTPTASNKQQDLLMEVARLEKTVEWMHDLIWNLIKEKQTTENTSES